MRQFCFLLELDWCLLLKQLVIVGRIVTTQNLDASKRNKNSNKSIANKVIKQKSYKNKCKTIPYKQIGCI